MEASHFGASPRILLQGAEPRGSALVRHYLSGRLLRIGWENGILKSVEPCETDSAACSLSIAPGLFDLQVNGYAGVDFQRAEAYSEEALLHAVHALRSDGCPRFLLTLITADWIGLLDHLGRIRTLVTRNPELRAAVAGWHIEGPFISSEPGYVGAHDTRFTCDPAPERIRELKTVTAGDAVLLSLAPERNGAEAAIREARECGFKVSFGHTNASSAELRKGLEAGAEGFTHLGNGCPSTLARRDNILWRALHEPDMTFGIIADGIHVSPPLFRLLHRAIPRERIYWTTDAVSAAGAPPGQYTLGRLELLVGADGIVRNPADETGFAGSSLRPIEGVRRGAAMLDIPWTEVWDFFSTAPSNWMGLPSSLEPGSPAGFCLLGED
jgi:N-acetylglucosamine-6-phosphate deacetylase